MMTLQRRPAVMLGGDEPYPLPRRLSIETTSSCNRSCSFCPISHGRRDFPTESMDDGLFSSILDQLAEHDWAGVLQMFLLNEPLLDPKLPDRLREAREKLPRCTVYLSTNGDPVDYREREAGVDWSVERLLKFWDAGATVINLNVYDAGQQGAEQLERYSRIVAELRSRGLARLTKHKYSPHPRSRHWVALTDMRPERVSASLVDMFYRKTDVDRVGVKAKQVRCARTQRHLVVRWDGLVPVCCATDPTSDDVPVVGDLRTQTVQQVWNGEALFRYRYYTQQGARVLPGCESCNHRMAYPHVVRQVDAPQPVKDRWARSLRAYERSLQQEAPA